MAEKYVKLSDVRKKVNYILKRNGSSPQTQRNVKDALNNLPYSVEAKLETTLEVSDVQPVKRGRWREGIPELGEGNFKYCSFCNQEAYWDTDYGQQLFKYCPNCGARMYGGEEK